MSDRVRTLDLYFISNDEDNEDTFQYVASSCLEAITEYEAETGLKYTTDHTIVKLYVVETQDYDDREFKIWYEGYCLGQGDS